MATGMLSKEQLEELRKLCGTIRSKPVADAGIYFDAGKSSSTLADRLEALVAEVEMWRSDRCFHGCGRAVYRKMYCCPDCYPLQSGLHIRECDVRQGDERGGAPPS